MSEGHYLGGLVRFLFDAQRVNGLEPRVIGLTSEGSRGGNYNHNRSRVEKFVLLEPNAYEETLCQIPRNRYIEFCPVGSPESAPNPRWKPSESDCGVWIASGVEICPGHAQGVPLAALNNALEPLRAAGFVSWTHRINPDPGPDDPDEIANDILCAVGVLDQPLSLHPYQTASKALDGVLRGIASKLLAQYGPEGELDCYNFYHEDFGPWINVVTLDGFPDADTRYRRVGLDELHGLRQRWIASGESIEIFRRLGRRSDLITGNERLSWFVEGVLPRGTVTLLAGARESGKSTLATELAVSAARSGDAEFLGQPISKSDDGVAVLLTGEDTDEIVNERRALLDPDDEVANLVVYALDGRPLADLCKEIARIPNLTLLVADPARRYLQGDEDGSDAVNQFFGQLDELTQQKKCATLVVHHLKKDAQPKSLAQVGQAIRGSGVFLDRPRVVLGMYRQGDVTHIGVIKNNIPNHPMLSEVALRRDDSTLRHVVIEADEPAATHVEVGNDVQARVYEALAKSIAKGHTLTRTGARELWQLRLGEIADISRDRIRAAVDTLIAQGKLLVQGSNLVLAS
jgi:hypothetical protein